MGVRLDFFFRFTLDKSNIWFEIILKVRKVVSGWIMNGSQTRQFFTLNMKWKKDGFLWEHANAGMNRHCDTIEVLRFKYSFWVKLHISIGFYSEMHTIRFFYSIDNIPNLSILMNNFWFEQIYSWRTKWGSDYELKLFVSTRQLLKTTEMSFAHSGPTSTTQPTSFWHGIFCPYRKLHFWHIRVFVIIVFKILS